MVVFNWLRFAQRTANFRAFVTALAAACRQIVDMACVLFSVLGLIAFTLHLVIGPHTRAWSSVSACLTSATLEFFSGGFGGIGADLLRADEERSLFEASVSGLLRYVVSLVCLCLIAAAAAIVLQTLPAGRDAPDAVTLAEILLGSCHRRQLTRLRAATHRGASEPTAALFFQAASAARLWLQRIWSSVRSETQFAAHFATGICDTEERWQYDDASTGQRFLPYDLKMQLHLARCVTWARAGSLGAPTPTTDLSACRSTTLGQLQARGKLFSAQRPAKSPLPSSSLASPTTPRSAEDDDWSLPVRVISAQTLWHSEVGGWHLPLQPSPRGVLQRTDVGRGGQSFGEGSESALLPAPTMDTMLPGLPQSDEFHFGAPPLGLPASLRAPRAPLPRLQLLDVTPAIARSRWQAAMPARIEVRAAPVWTASQIRRSNRALERCRRFLTAEKEVRGVGTVAREPRRTGI